MRGRRRLALISLFTFAACATPAPRRTEVKGVEAPAAAPSAPVGAAANGPGSSNPVEEVPLEVVLTDQTTDGGVMKLRAKIVNPFHEVVKGVRVQLVFLVPTGDDSRRVAEIQQKELGATLKPGGSTMLRWDVESMSLSAPGRFILAAYPKQLGDKAMPPPDNWKEDE